MMPNCLPHSKRRTPNLSEVEATPTQIEEEIKEQDLSENAGQFVKSRARARVIMETKMFTRENVSLMALTLTHRSAQSEMCFKKQSWRRGMGVRENANIGGGSNPCTECRATQYGTPWGGPWGGSSARQGVASPFGGERRVRA
jgi:hypothetical protein